MKTIILVVLIMLIGVTCYADPTLWRYTDKVSGKERGISYGDKMENPKWKAEVILESQKEYYVDLYKQQLAAEEKAAIDDKKAKSQKCVGKLKSLGFDKDEIQAILGNAYGD